MSPDRLSVFNYAHMPQRFMPQRRINEEDLPLPDQKLIILQESIDTLLADTGLSLYWYGSLCQTG